MADRRPIARNNNYLEEAMALLIRNQAAFVEQISRNDQGWLEIREWQRKTEARLEKIETALIEMPNIILKAVLDQLPKAVKKEIGFKSLPTR